MSRATRPRHAGSVPFGDRLRIERYLLDNGLELLVLPDPSAAIVSYQSWFRVGSRDETRGKTGQAHLLEHMMFIATRRFAEGEFDRRIERAGGESNAATWVDWTYYYENLPASELPLAIELEAERMHQLVLTGPRVAREKEVVLSERRDRVEDDIDDTVSEALYADAFGRTHPYGWPTIGWKRDIEGFTARDCARFYARHYAPDRATIVVAGDVEPEAVARRIGRAYGAIAASNLARVAVPAPRAAKARARVLALPTPSEKVALAWRAPRFVAPEHACAVIAAQVLAGGRSARLHRELVEEEELATEVRASVSPFEHHALFELRVSARQGVSSEPILERIERALARLVREPMGARELEKVKNRLELGFLSGMETIPGKAEQIGFSAVVAREPAHAFTRLEEYRGARPEDVRRVCAAMLEAPRVTVRVTPKDPSPGRSRARRAA